MFCHDLPVIARCVGVVITDDVRIQVKGMLMEFLPKGDLGCYCGYGPSSYFRSLHVKF